MLLLPLLSNDSGNNNLDHKVDISILFLHVCLYIEPVFDQCLSFQYVYDEENVYVLQ